MNEKIKTMLLNLFLMILSGFLANNLPISIYIFKINSPKILNSFDIAFYTTLFSILIEIINEIINKQRMKVKLSLIARQQENQKLIVRPDMVTSNIEVLIKINITGSTRKPYSKLVTKFPDYFTLQLSRGHSNFINIVENRIEMDLLKLTTTVQQKNVSFEREVEFNISLDSHNVGNSDYIKFDFDRFISNPLINFDSTGLTIEQKGQ